MYDLRCDGCARVEIDVLQPVTAERVSCACGGTMWRTWIGKASNVIGDDIPGGIEIKHGICHEDGTPRRYYSKSEMAREAKRRGWVNAVEHIGSPGSDKHRKGYTSRWV